MVVLATLGARPGVRGERRNWSLVGPLRRLEIGHPEDEMVQHPAEGRAPASLCAGGIQDELLVGFLFLE